MKYFSYITFALLFFLISCSSAQKFNPFVKPKDEIYASIKTIALAPIGIPKDLPRQKELQQYFESRITQKLESFGFTVLSSDKYDKTYTAMIKSMGGLYDSMTGTINKEKYDAVIKHSLRQMKAIHNADAVVFSSISVFNVDFSNSTAAWDGTSEGVENSSTIPGQIIGGLFGFRKTYSGKCPVLSLVVELVDVFNNTQYYNRGGLQMISKIGAKGTFVNVPLNELLTDESVNAYSIKVALDPLDKKTKKRK